MSRDRSFEQNYYSLYHKLEKISDKKIGENEFENLRLRLLLDKEAFVHVHPVVDADQPLLGSLVSNLAISINRAEQLKKFVMAYTRIVIKDHSADNDKELLDSIIEFYFSDELHIYECIGSIFRQGDNPYAKRLRNDGIEGKFVDHFRWLLTSGSPSGTLTSLRPVWGLERLKQIVQFLKAMLIFFSEENTKRDPRKVLQMMASYSEMFDQTFRMFLDLGIDGITILTYMQQIASLISLIVIAILKLNDFASMISTSLSESSNNHAGLVKDLRSNEDLCELWDRLVPNMMKQFKQQPAIHSALSPAFLAIRYVADPSLLTKKSGQKIPACLQTFLKDASLEDDRHYVHYYRIQLQWLQETHIRLSHQETLCDELPVLLGWFREIYRDSAPLANHYWQKENEEKLLLKILFDSCFPSNLSVSLSIINNLINCEISANRAFEYIQDIGEINVSAELCAFSFLASDGSISTHSPVQLLQSFEFHGTIVEAGTEGSYEHATGSIRFEHNFNGWNIWAGYLASCFVSPIDFCNNLDALEELKLVVETINRLITCHNRFASKIFDQLVNSESFGSYFVSSSLVSVLSTLLVIHNFPISPVTVELFESTLESIRILISLDHHAANDALQNSNLLEKLYSISQTNLPQRPQFSSLTNLFTSAQTSSDSILRANLGLMIGVLQHIQRFPVFQGSFVTAAEAQKISQITIMHFVPCLQFLTQEVIPQFTNRRFKTNDERMVVAQRLFKIFALIMTDSTCFFQSPKTKGSEIIEKQKMAQRQMVQSIVDNNALAHLILALLRQSSNSVSCLHSRAHQKAILMGFKLLLLLLKTLTTISDNSLNHPLLQLLMSHWTGGNYITTIARFIEYRNNTTIREYAVRTLTYICIITNFSNGPTGSQDLTSNVQQKQRYPPIITYLSPDPEFRDKILFCIQAQHCMKPKKHLFSAAVLRFIYVTLHMWGLDHHKTHDANRYAGEILASLEKILDLKSSSSSSSSSSSLSSAHSQLSAGVNDQVIVVREAAMRILHAIVEGSMHRMQSPKIFSRLPISSMIPLFDNLIKVFDPTEPNEYSRYYLQILHYINDIFSFSLRLCSGDSPESKLLFERSLAPFWSENRLVKLIGLINPGPLITEWNSQHRITNSEVRRLFGVQLSSFQNISSFNVELEDLYDLSLLCHKLRVDYIDLPIYPITHSNFHDSVDQSSSAPTSRPLTKNVSGVGPRFSMMGESVETHVHGDSRYLSAYNFAIANQIVNSVRDLNNMYSIIQVQGSHAHTISTMLELFMLQFESYALLHRRYLPTKPPSFSSKPSSAASFMSSITSSTYPSLSFSSSLASTARPPVFSGGPSEAGSSLLNSLLCESNKNVLLQLLCDQLEGEESLVTKMSRQLLDPYLKITELRLLVLEVMALGKTSASAKWEWEEVDCLIIAIAQRIANLSQGKSFNPMTKKIISKQLASLMVFINNQLKPEGNVLLSENAQLALSHIFLMLLPVKDFYSLILLLVNSLLRVNEATRNKDGEDDADEGQESFDHSMIVFPLTTLLTELDKGNFWKIIIDNLSHSLKNQTDPSETHAALLLFSTVTVCRLLQSTRLSKALFLMTNSLPRSEVHLMIKKSSEWKQVWDQVIGLMGCVAQQCFVQKLPSPHDLLFMENNMSGMQSVPFTTTITILTQQVQEFISLFKDQLFRQLVEFCHSLLENLEQMNTSTTSSSSSSSSSLNLKGDSKARLAKGSEKSGGQKFFLTTQVLHQIESISRLFFMTASVDIAGWIRNQPTTIEQVAQGASLTVWTLLKILELPHKLLQTIFRPTSRFERHETLKQQTETDNVYSLGSNELSVSLETQIFNIISDSLSTLRTFAQQPRARSFVLHLLLHYNIPDSKTLASKFLNGPSPTSSSSSSSSSPTRSPTSSSLAVVESVNLLLRGLDVLGNFLESSTDVFFKESLNHCLENCMSILVFYALLTDSTEKRKQVVYAMKKSWSDRLTGISPLASMIQSWISLVESKVQVTNPNINPNTKA